MDLRVDSSKKNLMSVCNRLFNEYGLFIIEKDAKNELKAAVEDLEGISEPPSPENYKSQFVGDWKLLCTTSTSIEGIDKSKIPSFLAPLETIRERIKDEANKDLTVLQRIRTNDNFEIDQIDHVLDINPPEPPIQLPDAIKDNLPSNVKVILAHKASIESESPLRTRLSLSSIVLNVAGKSTMLDPKGKDVAAINFPLGEFINSGDFETTYLDDNLRISRGKQGLVDQLRVFVRYTDQPYSTEEDVGMDVDEVVDSSFEYEEEAEPEKDDTHEGQDDVSPSDY
jgi:hypothetical protein